MIKRLLNSQTKTIAASAIVLAVATLLSRILGLVRDRLLAGRFGAGTELDVYFASFQIPDLIYNILFTGSIVVCFLPLFSEYYLKNKEESWRMMNHVLNIFLFLLLSLLGLFFILAPWLVEYLVPGFTAENKAMVTTLTRIMFLSPLFLGLSSIFSGVLHYFNRFLAYSLAPIFYNLGIIFGILFLAPQWGILGVSLGVVLGAFCHMLIQIPSAIKSGFRYKMLFDFKYPAVKKMFLLAIPRTIAAAASQINFIVITIIASTLAVGSLTVFNFANNLRYLPVGLIGISFATVSFPFLSKAWASNQKKAFINSFSSIFRQILFWVVPISLLMFILRAQFIRLVLGTGEFGWLETRLTAACLGIYCLGIFAQALIPTILRMFFSLQDTKTPTVIAVATIFLNIIFSIVFVSSLGFSNWFSNFMRDILKLEEIQDIAVVGLPLAFTLIMLCQFVLLLIFLYKKIGDIDLKRIINSFFKIIIAAVFMIPTTYVSLYIFAEVLDTKTFLGLFLQAGIAGTLGMLFYLFVSFLLKSSELAAAKTSIFREFRSQFFDK
ncbi:murein biosynthesis integral membrane protein MurJ [Candidatus Parcubacteria bacterium]|nr:murein biosynthesis integral membrane protein MurJ [Candidatus Parcubacteria bacterium]